jgi:hypothetical protein
MKQLQQLAYKIFPGLFYERPKGIFDNRHLLGRQIAKMLSGKDTSMVSLPEYNELCEWRLTKFTEGFYWRQSSIKSERRNFFLFTLNHGNERPKLVAVEYNKSGVLAAYNIFYKRTNRQTGDVISSGYEIELREAAPLDNEGWSEYLDGALVYEMARSHTAL